MNYFIKRDKKWGEKGFTFPVTLCILLLFSILFTTHINQYLIEKRFYAQVEAFDRNQYYFLSSLLKVEEQLKMESYSSSGSYRYTSGTVEYVVSETNPNLLRIGLHLRTDSNEVLTGTGYYDKELQKIIKWVERN